jgi:hypothetical protein
MNDDAAALDQRRNPTIRTWLGLGAAAALVLAMVVLIVAACLGPGLPMAAGTGPSPAPTASAGADDPGAGSGEDGGGEDGSGEDGSGGQPGTAPAPGQGGPGNQPPTGPVIEVFRVTQQPQCPGGTTEHMIEGQPVGLEWKVTGADGDQVSLSIDGPGVYDTYAADGSDVINFPCEGEAGDIQEHTYLLTAVGDGRTATRTLVVTATVQDVTPVQD